MAIPRSGDIDTVLRVLEARRPQVASHSRRVSAYGVLLASQYGLSPELVETIRIGGLLHDVGKLTVPARILSKPGPVTVEEWSLLQSHPEHGCVIVQQLGLDEAVTDIVLYHHERLDGRGYPDGLTGDLIPFPVRIISVMDAFDALTSPRPYREALSIDGARTVLAHEASSRYCAWSVSGLLSLPRPMLAAIAHNAFGAYQPEARPGDDTLAAATTPWMASLFTEPEQASAYWA